MDRFGLLLLVATASVIVQSLVDVSVTPARPGSVVAAVSVSLFVGATLLLSVRSAGVTRRWIRVADIVVAAGVVASGLLLAPALLSEGVAGTGRQPSLAWMVLAALAPILVARRVLHHRRASSRTLLGAVSAYLLFALFFTYAFQAVEVVQDTPFFEQQEPSTSFVYYSLVTITTLGYGDLTAATQFGRLLSVLEALIGQVYLVTFVGLVVGLLVNRRGALLDGREGDEPEPDSDAAPG